MMRRPIRSLRLGIVLATTLVGFSVAPGSAAIHEKVAKFCSGGSGNLDPGGQVRFGSKSFLRALQATGIYTIRFGEEPDGTPNATAVTIDIDYDRPSSSSPWPMTATSASSTRGPG